jgi:hypothetical protein
MNIVEEIRYIFLSGHTKYNTNNSGKNNKFPAEVSLDKLMGADGTKGSHLGIPNHRKLPTNHGQHRTMDSKPRS